MDSIEAARTVHERILRLEPENVARKVVGYTYLHLSDQEMIRLALGPEQLIHNLIQKAKAALMLSSTPSHSPPINPSPISDPSFPQFAPFSPVSSPGGPLSSSTVFRVAGPYWEHQVAAEQQPVHNLIDVPFMFSDSVHDEYRLQNHFTSFEEQLEPGSLRNSDFPPDFYYPETCRGPVNRLDFPVKTCHYFNKGFCKHGSNCRYFHGQLYPESYPRVFGPNSNENACDDQLISPGSLEKLELEIIELLKSKRSCPVSIASLPMMYYEKYGRTLQAEGYLTESQRHGKAGYSLTKLLARLKNSIRLIDRPHGQHAVMLAEDASKYLDIRGERNDPGPIVSDSHQIYLTFPAESTFTDEDVRNYFNTFGPVKDVRMPCPHKRMFGFVSFHSPDTVKIILSKGNPHYVCGARVLVKPYREKSKLGDRKYQEKFESQMCYHFDHIMDPDFQGRLQPPRMLRNNLMQDHEQALGFEAQRFSQLELARNHISNQSCFGYSMEGLKLSEEDSLKSPSPESLCHLLDVLSYGSTIDDKLTNTAAASSHFIDQEREVLNLPDSPFEMPVAPASSIPSAI